MSRYTGSEAPSIKRDVRSLTRPLPLTGEEMAHRAILLNRYTHYAVLNDEPRLIEAWSTPVGKKPEDREARREIRRHVLDEEAFEIFRTFLHCEPSF